MLTLADLNSYSESEIKEHIANAYAEEDNSFTRGSHNEKEQQELRDNLANLEVVVAYESVGSWGCDSSSWYLFRDKDSGEYFIISGSHCSCYGFEGQGDLEPTSIEYLQSDRFYLPTGGYDDDDEKNVKAVKEVLASLKE